MVNTTRMIRIEIHLTKAQKEMSMDILFRCHRLWNLYIERAIEALNSHQYIPDNYAFDKIDYQTRIKPSDHEVWSSLPNKARRDCIDRCYRAIMQYKKQHGRYNLHLRSWRKNPVSSFFFVKDGIRLIDDSHIWIPILRIIKLKEKWNERISISNITSGRIVYNFSLDRWYVCFIGTASLDYGNKPWLRKNTPGLGIDMGLRRYFTTWFGDSENNTQIAYNPITDSKLLSIDRQINRLNQVIDRKIQWNKVAHGYKRHENGKNIPKEKRQPIYNTKAIRKFRRRISRLYYQARCYRQDAMRKLCNTLVRFQPEFICMENLDVLSMMAKGIGHNSTLRRHVSGVAFYSTTQCMKWQCQKYGIPFIQADRFYPSSQYCSSCGHQQKMPLNRRTYKCPECGMKMDRDLNAAKNLYLYGKENVTVLYPK